MGIIKFPMFEDDQVITSFITNFSNYYFKVMLFGLTDLPSTFQKKMNRTFFDLINVCEQIYLDDIIYNNLLSYYITRFIRFGIHFSSLDE